MGETRMGGELKHDDLSAKASDPLPSYRPGRYVTSPRSQQIRREKLVNTRKKRW
jgi:hypothetical protein